MTKSKQKLASEIRSYLRNYFLRDKKFKKLSDNEKLYVYSLYNRLLHIIYLQLKHPGILPILFVHHPKTKKILEQLFQRASVRLPFLEDITVVVMH